MVCTRCGKQIELESPIGNDILINCEDCGDFCSPACFNLYHDENPHKQDHKRNEVKEPK